MLSAKMVLGPRQQDGAGACRWTTDFLSEKWKNRTTLTVQGDAAYDDIFNDPHLTRYCREITIDSDPHSPELQQVSALCPQWPDCTDKQCERTATNLPPP
jgi:hypothetical protein